MNRKVLGGLVALVAVASITGVVMANKSDEPATHDTSSTGQHTANNGDEAAANNDAPTASDTVAITDFDFKPGNITVKKGTTVTWTNNDNVEHTVTTTGNAGPDSELFGKGETYSYTFNEVGIFDYFCAPHPQMTGSVTVTE